MPSPQLSPEKPRQLEDSENVTNSLFYMIMLHKLLSSNYHHCYMVQYWFQNEAKHDSPEIKRQQCKDTQEFHGSSTGEVNVEPLNFKLTSTPGRRSKDVANMEVDSLETTNHQLVKTSHAIVPHPPTTASTTKIYANLESAMPVAGISPQSPITIQTIEVNMWPIRCLAKTNEF